MFLPSGWVSLLQIQTKYKFKCTSLTDVCLKINCYNNYFFHLLLNQYHNIKPPHAFLKTECLQCTGLPILHVKEHVNNQY